MTGEGTVGPKIDERIALRIGWSISVIGFLVQMATNGRYGYLGIPRVRRRNGDHVGVAPRECRKSV